MPENKKIIDLVDPNNIGKIRFLSEGNTYIPWLINKDNTKILVFRYDDKIKYHQHFSMAHSMEYKILDITPNKNINIYQISEVNDIFTTTSQGRLYMQTINNYFTSDNFDYSSIFTSIKNNYDDSEIKDKLINILHKENFWDIKDIINLKVDISSSEAREIVVNIFKKSVLDIKKEVICTKEQKQENETSNQPPKFSFIKSLTTFFKSISSLFQKKDSSEIDENSLSNNNQSKLEDSYRRNTTNDFDPKIKSIIEKTTANIESDHSRSNRMSA